MATSSATLASEPTRGSEGKEVATLQIQIGPPDRPATPSDETPQRTPAVAMSDQNRGRQRISWSGNDQPLMRPPPHLHSHRPSVDDSVPCPQRAFSPLFSRRLNDPRSVVYPSVRARHRGLGRRSDGSASAPGGRFNERRSSYSDGNV